MTEADGSYSSTVIAPAQIVLGVVGGIVVALLLLALSSGLWPFAIVAFLVIVVVAYYLAPVTLTVTRRRITIGQGRWERQPRFVDANDVVDASAEQLSWTQCFGIGVAKDAQTVAGQTTRLSVRSGPTLRLALRDGEVIRVSTTDPDAALNALGRGGSTRPRPPRPTPRSS